jgi:hypothetical protein
MTPLTVFCRTLMKSSAVILGAAVAFLQPSFDWPASRHTVPPQQRPADAATALAFLALVPHIVEGSAATVQARGVREMTADLSSAEPVVRARAACDLREQGDGAASAIPQLVGLLPDLSPIAPDVCREHWWRGGDKDTTTPGEQAAAALVAIGSRAFQPLLGALKGTAWAGRRNAAWALGALDDKRAVAALIEALHDREASVREQVAWALGALDDAAAVPGLVAALKDEDARVRKQAAWALGAIGDRGALDALLVALKDNDPAVRRQAAWAIGAIGR